MMLRPQKYRLRGKPFEAVKLTDAVLDAPHPSPLHIAGVTYDPIERCAYVATPDGMETVALGDWIVLTANGQVTWYRAAVFEAAFEPVEGA